MNIKRRRSDFVDWQSHSMLTPFREQAAFLLGGLVFISVAAIVLSFL